LAAAAADRAAVAVPTETLAAAAVVVARIQKLPI
jgi:hypothetical protein